MTMSSSGFAVLDRLTPVALYEEWRSKIWTLRPVYVLQSTADELVLWMQPGTRYLSPVAPDGGPVPCFLPDEWSVTEKSWHGGGCVYLLPARAHHMLPARTTC